MARASCPRAACPSVHVKAQLVSVFDAKIGLVSPSRRETDLEDLRQAVGGALAALVAEVEGLGGTVTSISGAGPRCDLRSPEAPRGRPGASRKGGGAGGRAGAQPGTARAKSWSQ